MENIREIIGENLASLRKEAKLTQLELAERFNYSDKAVSKWEKGDTIPDIETLYNLCQFYGVTIDYLTHKGAPSDKKEFITRKDSDFSNKILITLLLVMIIWMIATIAFVYTSITLDMGYWQSFIWAVPASCILVLGINRKLFRSSTLSFICESVGIWSLLSSFYFSFSIWSLWPIFLLGIPLQAALGIWYVMNKTKK
ncbi:MAG TPA: helix-turn-helix transcriptional regulator [Bacilli bacterium]|nr:helix-turn-helix transcriptional regulator [Bacilli bacterium]HPS19093.1 helix-turn-helix transcriptional regulator [Bacilli bacterium]